jgi:hypothetical protein
MRLFHILCSVFSLVLVAILLSTNAAAWKNESYTTDISSPGFGTHDWIANNSLSMVPLNESQYIHDYLNYYYYGTELPDNANPLLGDGYGDTTKHHVYFDAVGTCTDSASADRAQAMYDLALAELKAGNYQTASKYAGTMTHYIADLAVFGHVMGATTTPWGAEVHHDDYESYVQNHHSTFESYIVFDGALNQIDAKSATITLAHDTTFDDSGGGKTCVWMDANYDWTSQAYKDRCGQSINKATNLVADVLHSLAVEAEYTTTSLPVTNTTDPTTNTTTPTTNTTVPTDNDTVPSSTDNTSTNQTDSTDNEDTPFPPILTIVAIVIVLSVITSIIHRRKNRRL